MKIKSISFSNFKYVAFDKKMSLNLHNAESLILGGPNGYGKTTVFDALELLITGKIRHFNAELLNRGKENISVLANNSNYDICIAAEFITSIVYLNCLCKYPISVIMIISTGWRIESWAEIRSMVTSH